MKTQFARRASLKISPFHPDYAFLTERVRAIEYMLANHYHETVLDFGAGNSPYRQLIQCHKYITADVEENPQNPIDLLLDRESSAINLSDESVDLALCMDVLEHIHDDLGTLHELHRVLKKEGMLLLSLPFMYREHEYPYDFRRYTSCGIKRLLQNVGFDLVEVRKIGNAWLLAFMVINERRILNGEIDCTGWFAKWVSRVFRFTVLPILNLTLFAMRPESNTGTFYQLLITAHK